MPNKGNTAKVGSCVCNRCGAPVQVRRVCGAGVDAVVRYESWCRCGNGMARTFPDTLADPDGEARAFFRAYFMMPSAT